MEGMSLSPVAALWILTSASSVELAASDEPRHRHQRHISESQSVCMLSRRSTFNPLTCFCFSCSGQSPQVQR